MLSTRTAIVRTKQSSVSRLLAAGLIGVAFLAQAHNGRAGECTGDETVWWQINEGEVSYAVVECGNGTWWFGMRVGDEYFWQEIEQVDNPNPEDGSTSPGDFNMRIQLLLQAGGGGMAGPAFEETPLGQYLTGRGQGVGPRHNPFDDTTGGQSLGAGSFRNPADDMFVIGEEGGVGGGGGISPEGGPIGEQVRNGLKKGGNGNGNGDDGDGDDKPPQGSGLWDDSMPGPPELVNPAPLSDGFVLLPQSMTRLNATSRARDTFSSALQSPVRFGQFGGGMAARPIGPITNGLTSRR